MKLWPFKFLFPQGRTFESDFQLHKSSIDYHLQRLLAILFLIRIFNRKNALMCLMLSDVARTHLLKCHSCVFPVFHASFREKITLKCDGFFSIHLLIGLIHRAIRGIILLIVFHFFNISRSISSQTPFSILPKQLDGVTGHLLIAVPVRSTCVIRRTLVSFFLFIFRLDVGRIYT